MKTNSTRKQVKRLSRYLGQEIIRFAPTLHTGDNSYMDTPMKLLGFSESGNLIMQYACNTFEHRYLSSEPRELPLDFTDCFWKLYKRAIKPKHNPLNQWRGKQIKRLTPTRTSMSMSYMAKSSFGEYPILVSASKTHMLIQSGNNVRILRPEYVNPEEWALVE